jgi:hypothetical protein
MRIFVGAAGRGATRCTHKPSKPVPTLIILIFVESGRAAYQKVTEIDRFLV